MWRIRTSTCSMLYVPSVGWVWRHSWSSRRKWSSMKLIRFMFVCLVNPVMGPFSSVVPLICKARSPVVVSRSYLSVYINSRPGCLEEKICRNNRQTNRTWPTNRPTNNFICCPCICLAWAERLTGIQWSGGLGSAVYFWRHNTST